MDDINSPERCAARAADPQWVAEQERKRDAASARYVDYRASVNLPLRQKGRLAR